MTSEQYKRWRDFSLRMARTCFKHRRNPTWRQIVSNVEDFFDCLDPEYLPSIVDWDNSAPYPKGHPYFSRTHRCPCRHCHGAPGQPDCPHRCEGGHIWDYAEAPLMCDYMTEFCDPLNPYGHLYYDMGEAEYRRREDQFCGPVRCCVRAGLDCAVAQSAGVLGFTAGDLRQMYPEGVPDWITGGPAHRWTHHPITGVVPGVGFALGDPSVNGTFDEITDEQEIWL